MPHYDPSTLNFYDANARSYSAVRPVAMSPELITFLPRLEPRGRILELGCGSGLDAEAMEQAGFVVDPTDGSPEMAALAAERLRRPVRTLRFDELDVVEGYDAVVACASLLHVPHGKLADVLERIWTALKPGGWHFASYKTGSEPGWDAHERYYNQLMRGDAERFYREAGDWPFIEYDEYDGEAYFSPPSRWLSVTARKVSF